MERIYAKKENVITPDCQGEEEDEHRTRKIWIRSDFQEWGKYIAGKVQNQEEEAQYQRKKEQRKQNSEELGNAKKELKEIRTRWKNEYIRITTEEIREAQKRRHQNGMEEDQRT